MSDYRRRNEVQPGGLKAGYVLILLVSSFACGAVLMGWTAQRFELFGNGSKAEAPAPVAPAKTKTYVDVQRNENERPTGPMAAQIASGSGAKVEALLLIREAKRAIDEGSALGDIESQLLDRFGEALPKDVAVIVQASKNPVTLDMLGAELKSQGNEWKVKGEDGGWNRFRQELGSLFVLRQEGTPSQTPSKRFEKAQLYIESGNIAAAVSEVKNMPGAQKANAWLQKADRFSAVRKSLNTIEQAALVRTVKATPIAPVTPTVEPEAEVAEPIAETAEPAASDQSGTDIGFTPQSDPLPDASKTASPE